MAIDTRSRRASVLAAGIMALVALPLPDGTVGTQDRPHVAGLYSGITIAAPAADPQGIVITTVVMTQTAIQSVAAASPTIDTVAISAPTLTDVTRP